jgi:hypothetical protein
MIMILNSVGVYGDVARYSIHLSEYLLTSQTRQLARQAK